MNIPEDRIIAANWVLQLSIFSFIINIMTAPYMAVVIAHEQMKVFAYLSIIKAIITLMSAYILQYFLYDHLVVYAILMFLCSFTIASLYRYYCRKHYQESHFSYNYNKIKLKEITAYLWWSMFGPIANIIRDQGINILLNIHFGPAINAARAISYQVNTAVNSFSSNFYSALRPQITKNYSAGDLDRMRNLIYSSSRLSFCLLLLFAVPIFFNTEQILKIWLVSYPIYSVIFLKLILLTSLIEVFNMPLTTGILATGKIRIHQQVIAAIYILNLPISIVLLNAGYDAECTLYVNMTLVIIALIPRVYLCNKYYGLDVPVYVFNVLLRCSIVLITCFAAGGLLSKLIHESKCNDGIIGLLACVLTIVLSVFIIIWLIGIKHNERVLIKTQMIKIIHKVG
jgi:O-antigen/teichoic acid export membrane protein